MSSKEISSTDNFHPRRLPVRGTSKYGEGVVKHSLPSISPHRVFGTNGTLFIAHEVNEVTAPLLRTGVIDFLITQRAEWLVRKTRQVLSELGLAKGHVRELNHVPFHVITEFNLDVEAGDLQG